MTEPPKKRMVRPPSGGGETARATPARLTSHKLRTASSRAWLERQINDPFAAEARARGYRSRAALKLAEIDDKRRLIRPGARIIDLGCAPGGWLQVALERGAARVAGIDLLPVDPLSGATVFEGDFTEGAWGERLVAAIGGPPDLVFSDMAPNTTGHRRTDHLRIMALLEAAAEFAFDTLPIGGTFLAKAFQGGETQAVVDRLKRRFTEVRHLKPRASRAESSELYILARGLRAPD